MKTKIALVTGSNRGIGLECVRQLAERGYKAILTSRDPKDGKNAIIQLAGAKNIYYHALDVSDDDSIAKIKEYVISNFGQLDILINNAGIDYDNRQQAYNADLEGVMSTIETNLMGPWKMAKAFVPLMKEKKYGRIVNVSSGSGVLSEMTGGTPGYGISKAALNALTIKLGDELKNTGILVNAVCPGWVRTSMGGAAAPRSVEKGAETIIWLAEMAGDGPTGKFFRDKKVIPF